MGEGFGGSRCFLVVFAVPPVSSEPSEGPFDNPSFRQDDEAFHADGSKDCLQHPAECSRNPIGKAIAAIGGVADVVILTEDGVAYLKVNRRELARDALLAYTISD